MSLRISAASLVKVTPLLLLLAAFLGSLWFGLAVGGCFLIAIIVLMICV